MRMICKEKEFRVTIKTADTFVKRFLGLMFRKTIDRDTALLITPCGSVHTCFMRFPIDVLYLDKDDRILFRETVRPWRIGKLMKGVRSVLELQAGAAAVLSAGDILESEEEEEGENGVI